VRPEGELAYLWLGQCRERWLEGEPAYLWLGQCRERWPEEPGHLLGEWVQPQLLDLSPLRGRREHQLWLAWAHRLEDRVCLQVGPAYLWRGQCRERWPEEPGSLLGEWVRPQLLDQSLLRGRREHQLWLAWANRLEGRVCLQEGPAYPWLGQCRGQWPEELGHLLGEWVRPQLLDLSLLLDCREHQLWLAWAHRLEDRVCLQGGPAYRWLGQCRGRWLEELGHLLGEWVRPQLLDLSLLLDCREHQLWLA
jgi:hypothetical protein